MLAIYDATWSNVPNASSYDNAYTYTGRRLDKETGIYYYRHRCYAARLGRFCSRDPIGYEGGLNLLGHVGSQATGGVDPSGLKCQCVVTRIVRTLSAYAVGLYDASWIGTSLNPGTFTITMHDPAYVICKQTKKILVEFRCRDAYCIEKPNDAFRIVHSIDQQRYGKVIMGAGAISVDVSIGFPRLFSDRLPILVYNQLKNFFNISIWAHFDTVTDVGRQDKRRADLLCKNQATYAGATVTIDEDGHYLASFTLPAIGDVFSCSAARNWKP